MIVKIMKKISKVIRISMINGKSFNIKIIKNIFFNIQVFFIF